MSENLKNLYLLGSVMLFSCLITYLFSHLLLTRDTYYHSYGEQLELSRIDELFKLQTRYSWLSILLIPIWLLIKNAVVSLCLQIGLLVQGIKLGYSKTFKIAIAAEFVFLLPQLIKLCWFLLVKTEYSIIDVQQFYPFSVLNLFEHKDLPAFLIYPFQTFNVFEILYWICLAGGLKKSLGSTIDEGIRVVFYGYIPALLLWVLCVTFIVVSISPAS